VIAAVIALGAVVVVLACVLGVVVRTHGEERREWASERRSLVDRAIARHAGETIALDRAANHSTEREKPPQVLVEGIN
jgi:FlaG/FlaF family flagellin (archaellin)